MFCDSHASVVGLTKIVCCVAPKSTQQQDNNVQQQSLLLHYSPSDVATTETHQKQQKNE